MTCSQSYTNFSRQIPHVTQTSYYPPPASLNRLIYINHTATYPYNIIIQLSHRSVKHAATGMSCELLPPRWALTNPGCRTMPTPSFARYWKQQRYIRHCLRALPLNAYKLKALSHCLFLLMNKYPSLTGFSVHLQEKWRCILNRPRQRAMILYLDGCQRSKRNMGRKVPHRL